jgi:hypothetical protein
MFRWTFLLLILLAPLRVEADAIARLTRIANRSDEIELVNDSSGDTIVRNTLTGFTAAFPLTKGSSAAEARASEQIKANTVPGATSSSVSFDPLASNAQGDVFGKLPGTTLSRIDTYQLAYPDDAGNYSLSRMNYWGDGGGYTYQYGNFAINDDRTLIAKGYVSDLNTKSIEELGEYLGRASFGPEYQGGLRDLVERYHTFPAGLLLDGNRSLSNNGSILLDYYAYAGSPDNGVYLYQPISVLQPTPVPEPAMFWIFSAAGAAAWCWRGRSRETSASGVTTAT